MHVDELQELAGILVLASPCGLVILLGLPCLLGVRLSEGLISKLTQAGVFFGIVPLLGILVAMWISDARQTTVDLGEWVAIPEERVHFHFKLLFDRLSITFTILSFSLCGVVGAFTRRYLHRESSYHRFFLLYALFLAGMTLSSLAGTIETLFFGWQLVGLSSALLVAYFHERPAPVRNGQRLWSVYRLADASFLLAALLIHHFTGQGDFSSYAGVEPWPGGVAHLSSSQALLVGWLLLLAAAGKSALLPFSGWLARAMEGPTLSSAIFYGALSVHLGVYLLLRTSPILAASLPLQVMVVLLGLASAANGALLCQVQSDVKSVLAYAALTQVGIIVMEIGLGLYYLALIHLLGHACLRTLQLLRALTLLKDYRALEKALGERLPTRQRQLAQFMPEAIRAGIYRVAYERGYMDLVLDRLFVLPFLHFFRWADGQERRWTDWLSGQPSRESDAIQRHPEDALLPEATPPFALKQVLALPPALHELS